MDDTNLEPVRLEWRDSGRVSLPEAGANATEEASTSGASGTAATSPETLPEALQEAGFVLHKVGGFSFSSGLSRSLSLQTPQRCPLRDRDLTMLYL